MSCSDQSREIRSDPPPVVLTVAGSDCSAGAGIQADLKTFAAHRVHGLTAVSAVVAETPLTVSMIHPIPPEVFRRQLDLLFRAYPVAAMKTGMLPGPEHVEILAASDLPGNLVIDPVLVSSSGTGLVAGGLVEALRESLFPRAVLVTPNLGEAAAICGEAVATAAEVERAGRVMADRFGCAFLVTGGHLEEAAGADDFLARPGGEGEWFRGPRVPGAGPVSHGTGCTLSAAITANLAHGAELPQAVLRAREYVAACLRAGKVWPSPGGGDIGALEHGPFEP